MTETTNPQGLRCAPDEVWARVREDYLAGRSASECCRRHGVGLTSLRNRAAREGWRRSDQPWSPPDRLDPWDEGVELEQKVGGDLDRVELYQLAYVAHRRMMRAVIRGDATEALRWRRVRLAMDEAQWEVEREAERQDDEIWRTLSAGAEVDGLNGLDGLDGLDGVFESGEDTAEDASGFPSPLAGEGGPEGRMRGDSEAWVMGNGSKRPFDVGSDPSPDRARTTANAVVRDLPLPQGERAATSETRSALTSPPVIRDPQDASPEPSSCPSPAPRS